jgi:hypothetical protein
MTSDPSATRSVGDTLDGEETLSYEDIVCLLQEGSGEILSPSDDDMVPSQLLGILCGRDKGG